METTFDSGPTIANDTGMNASDTKKSRLDTLPSISGGTRRCSSVPQMTMPAPSVTPTMNVASAISGNDDVTPTITSGMEPALHMVIITVRYRRGSRLDDTAKAPSALPIPKKARMKP